MEDNLMDKLSLNYSDNRRQKMITKPSRFPEKYKEKKKEK